MKKHTPVDAVIKKSNSLVEARYRFNTWEMRVFTKMISMVRSEDKDFKTYRIQLRELMLDFGLENNRSSYEHLRQAAYSLAKKEANIYFEENGKLRLTRTHLLVDTTEDVETDDSNAPPYIDVTFHAKLKPLILDLKNQYTLYDVQNILNLPSTYLVRLYELLKQYEGIGHRTFDFNELKEMIGAIETWEEGPSGRRVTKSKDYFPLYGNFKQKVLNKGLIKFAEHTDITYEFEPIKVGRKVAKIRFKILKNTAYKKPQLPSTETHDLFTPPAQEQGSDQERIKRFADQLKPYGVATVSVKQWVTQFSDEAIQKAVTYTINKINTGTQISNIGGYIRTMMNTPDAIDPVEIERKKKQEALQKEKAQAQKKEKLQEEYNRMSVHLTEKQEDAIRGIFANDPAAKQKVFLKTTKTKGSGYNPSRTNAELMQDAYFRGVFRGTARKMFPDQFDHLKDLDDEVRKVRGIISRM
jgi:plasmid replication initiation protein